METLSHISEIIFKIIWAIVGGAISIAFIVGSISAIGYMIYYICKHGWKKFDQEFIR